MYSLYYCGTLYSCLKKYLVEGLNFFSDKNPRVPFDKGAISIETHSAQLYQLLNEYRYHEVHNFIKHCLLYTTILLSRLPSCLLLRYVVRNIVSNHNERFCDYCMKL